MKYFIADLIPYLVVLAQLILVGVLLFWRTRIVSSCLRKNSMKIVFVMSLLATLGSLFYSLIMGYQPCDLCWYQRILMYPLVVIAGFSLAKQSPQARSMILTLAGLGLLFSGYHYIIQLTNTASFCSAESVSCTSNITFTFGYISIPLMAFTAFALIILGALTGRSDASAKRIEK